MTRTYHFASCMASAPPVKTQFYVAPESAGGCGGGPPYSVAAKQQQQTQQQQQPDYVTPAYASMAHNNSALPGGPNTNTNSNPTNKQQQHMTSKILAHSSSLLNSSNDSYMAGMSSDSELTASGASNRHHHRPYSSQSRVYHAHPAPRSSQASSRMSHHSDPTASSYCSSSGVTGISGGGGDKPQGPHQPSSISSLSAPSQQHQQQQQPVALAQAHSLLSQQGSFSSSGNGGSQAPTSAAYLAGGRLGESPISPALPRAVNSRQLPQRPFKQSMSIDHHSAGQYHHHHLQQQQQQQAMAALGQHQQQQFVHPMAGPHIQHLQQQHIPYESSDMTSAYQQQQHASASTPPSSTHSYPGSGGSLISLAQQRGHSPQAGPLGEPSSSQQQQQQQQSRYERQRNFRLEMEMLDKRAAAVNLNDNETSTGGLPGSTSTQATQVAVAANLPTNVTASRQRQLPPTNQAGIGSMSVDHLHHQQLEQYHPGLTQAGTDIQKQQQQQNQYHSMSQAIYNPQQQDPYLHMAAAGTSPAVDWLPPIGPSYGPAHQLPRTSAGGGSQQQFKQTVSIDHYPVASQQQARHYSPARAPHFNEHYRAGSLAYTTSSGSPVRAGGGGGGNYESPNQQQQQQQLGSYHHASNTSDLHNDASAAFHYLQEQQQQQQQGAAYSLSSSQSARNALELQSHDSNYHHPAYSTPGSNFNQPMARSATLTASNQRPKLQHQPSSSSSNNSQSGSLKSSNLDINRSLATDHQHQQKALSHFQNQQQHQSPQHHVISKSYGDQQQQQLQQQQQQSHHHKHGVLRKGYTSVASSLAGSNVALNELLDPVLPLTAAQTSSHGSLMASAKSRSVLRSTSPSSALGNDQATSASATGKHYTRETGSTSSGGVVGTGSRSESSTGLPSGLASNNPSSLTKKSNSATQLSMTGTKKRLGFRKKQVTSFSVHRSEEVAPMEARHLVKQGSSVSEGESSLSGDSSSRSWSNSNFKQQTPDELASISFIDGLGKGQMISRQGLASPYLGDIQLSLCDRRGNLEVEVIRARNLQAKANKILPLTYVKLYLVKNRKCLAKAKTTLCNKRTLDPLFQQQLVFHEDYHGSILQSIVWGNFGKMDKKNFMGIAQISIDDLELNDTVISWYKLFLPSSLQTLPSKSLRHTLLSNSTESFTNTNTNNS